MILMAPLVVVKWIPKFVQDRDLLGIGEVANADFIIKSILSTYRFAALTILLTVILANRCSSIRQDGEETSCVGSEATE